MDCGTGPDRLGYGGCAKGLILEENDWIGETTPPTVQYQMCVEHRPDFVISDKCFTVKIC